VEWLQLTSLARRLGAIAFLLSASCASAQSVAPWDCTTYPYPVQIIKGGSATSYRTMQLNFGSGTFTEMWQWTDNTNLQHPTTQMNAQAYNVNDGIAYGLFSTSSSQDYSVAPGYLCRFSHVQNSAVCLCQAPYWGYGLGVQQGV
jgi:hypothetical protein